jgi:hypothetical protein
VSRKEALSRRGGRRVVASLSEVVHDQRRPAQAKIAVEAIANAGLARESGLFDVGVQRRQGVISSIRP